MPDDVWTAIEAGERPVKVLRKHRGLTQVELAAAAGVNQGYVAELEPETLKALARALGVPLDVLVE